MDLLWYAQENEIPIAEVMEVMDLTEKQVKRAYSEFVRKRRTTEYLRTSPIRLDYASGSFNDSTPKQATVHLE
jgi:NAD+ synthase